MNVVVSVIIPTYKRPYLIKRAVQSALNQTFKDIEVIVVIDGPDQTTREVLADITDTRLGVCELPANMGVGNARNAGISKAKGTWIALLDDDDEWLPEKLERQLDYAASSRYELPIVTCQVIARTPRGEYIWPKRLPRPSEPLSEYLFARNTLFVGEGLIATPTILTKKTSFQYVPLNEGLPRHGDWEWLLQINNIKGTGIEFVSEPLAICYFEQPRESLSNVCDWRFSLTFIQKHRHLVTPRAYSGFIMTEVAGQASQLRNWKTFVPLLQEAIRYGQPELIHVLVYVGIWLLPQETRRWLRAMFTGNSRQARNSS